MRDHYQVLGSLGAGLSKAESVKWDFGTNLLLEETVSEEEWPGLSPRVACKSLGLGCVVIKEFERQGGKQRNIFEMEELSC